MSNTHDAKQWRWGLVKRAVMNYYIKNPDTRPIVAIKGMSDHYPYKDKKTRCIDTEKRRLYNSDRKKINRVILEFWDMGLLTTQDENKNIFIIARGIMRSSLEKFYFERKRIQSKALRLSKDHPLFEDYKNRYC